MTETLPQNAFKAFLESVPPNTPERIAGGAIQQFNQYRDPYYELPKSRIQLHCPKDDGVRWFESRSNFVLEGTWFFSFITYTCRDCGVNNKTYALLTRRETKDGRDIEVMKLGEYPPFGAPIAKRVSKLLTEEDLELYRKGARAEAQGLGIGAATYFRRIVE